MPFTKLPLSTGGSLVADHIPTRITTKTTATLAISDPIEFKISHTTTAVVKLAVEYLESPYPNTIEIQCQPAFVPYISRVAR